MYDPIKDLWEEGVPLTSGRSGLASAVIYQPSMPGNYAQDCLTNLSRSREYDDKGGADNNEDDGDFMSRGSRSSYHINLPSNFYRGAAGGNVESSEMNADELVRCLRTELLKRLKSCRRTMMLHDPADKIHSDTDKSIRKCITNNRNNPNHECPLQRIRRQIKWLMSTGKLKNREKPKTD